MFASNGWDAAAKEFISTGRCDWIALYRGGEMVECYASGSTWGQGSRDRSGDIGRKVCKDLPHFPC